MLRYKTEIKPGLVALYDIRPGNGAGLFLQPRSPHGANNARYRLDCILLLTLTTTAMTSCAGGRHNMPPPLQVDIWPFDLESGVRVTCDVGYLCTNFGLPRPCCSRLRPDVRDRQTSDVRQKHRLMSPPIRGGA